MSLINQINKSDNRPDSSLPVITVVLPVYNAEKYLRLAVLSIIKQSFEDWELLLIDDGSTDNGLATILDICDVRVRVISDGENRGLVSRLNQAIDFARGSYLARMDADDVSHPDRFKRQIDTLRSDPSLDVVAVRAFEIDDNNQVTGLFPFSELHEDICCRPWLGFHMLHPTWMGHIEWFRRHRYLVPAPVLCEDQELLLRSYRTSRFLAIDEFLFGYRVRSIIDFIKLSKTRVAVREFQVRHFLKNRQWYYLAMAVVAYRVRLLHDFFRRYGIMMDRRRTKVISEAVVHEWGEVVQNVLLDNETTTDIR